MYQSHKFSSIFALFAIISFIVAILLLFAGLL